MSKIENLKGINYVEQDSSDESLIELPDDMAVLLKELSKTGLAGSVTLMMSMASALFTKVLSHQRKLLSAFTLSVVRTLKTVALKHY